MSKRLSGRDVGVFPPAVMADYNYNLYGPVAVGTMIYQIIYGMFMATASLVVNAGRRGLHTIQAYFYLRLYPRDPLYMRGTVLVLGVLGTTETIVLMIRLFQVLVEHPQDYDYYGDIGRRPAGWLYLLFANLIGMVCQTFMAGRIVQLSRALRESYTPARRWWEVWLMQPLLASGLVLSYASGLAVPIWLSIAQPRLYRLIDPNDPSVRDLFRFFVVWQPLCFTFTDVLITTIMTMQAWGARGTSRKSSAALSTVVGITFTNGLLVAALQIGQVCTTFSTHATWIELCIPIMPAFHSLTVVSILLQPRFTHERSPVVIPAPLETDTLRLGTGISWAFGQTSSVMAVEEGELPRSAEAAWRRRKSSPVMSGSADQRPEAAAGRHLQVTVVDPLTDGNVRYTSGSHFRAPDTQP